MPHESVWIQGNQRCGPRRRISGRQSAVALLHSHKRADGKFGEKFASSVFGQPDAAV